MYTVSCNIQLSCKFNKSYFLVLGDCPDHTDPHCYMDSFGISWRIHHHPRCTWTEQSPQITTLMQQYPVFSLCSYFELHGEVRTTHNVTYWPFGQCLRMPILARSCPSHCTAHSRSPGPALIWATSVESGTGTFSQTVPSGFCWCMPERNHTWAQGTDRHTKMYILYILAV